MPKSAVQIIKRDSDRSSGQSVHSVTPLHCAVAQLSPKKAAPMQQKMNDFGFIQCCHWCIARDTDPFHGDNVKNII